MKVRTYLFKKNNNNKLIIVTKIFSLNRMWLVKDKISIIANLV